MNKFAKRLTRIAIAGALGLVAQSALANISVSNTDWEIILTDHGYSDLLLDKRPGYEGREYLSGEWAGAVGYTRADMSVVSPTWLEPDFIFPDWTTNSNFAVAVAINDTGVNNADGFDIYGSVIQNPDLTISMTYEMLDTVTGTPTGLSPASLGGGGASQNSNRYVLKQTYSITNSGDQDLVDLNLFQFLHSLEATTALFDDRFYAGALSAYQFDITQQGTSFFGGATHDDTVAFHSSVTPTAYEVGRYGVDGVDGHDIGKPTSGVHLSVEADALSGVDSFAPTNPDKWVSGAQRFNIGSLAQTETKIFDVLVSIDTETQVIPLPAAVWLFGAGLLGLLTFRRR